MECVALPQETRDDDNPISGGDGQGGNLKADDVSAIRARGLLLIEELVAKFCIACVLKRGL